MKQEHMNIKVGQERTDVWGTQVGFASTDGYELFPVQLGPALATDADQSLGRIYVFGAPTDLSPTNYKVARRTDEASEPALRRMRGVTVLRRADGSRLALFESPYWLERVEGGLL